MFRFPQAALNAICAAPDSWLDPGWEKGYHELLAYMGANHPEWTDGVKVVPNDGEDRTSGDQYKAYLENLICKGVRFDIDNCRSYWLINRFETVVEGKEIKHIELEYVSNFGNCFTGHAPEYFPLDSTFLVFGALRHRVKHGLTNKRSPFGAPNSEEAQLLHGAPEVYY